MSATIAIVGNPNVGKTEIFNALTGLAQTTGNYPGVTVTRKHGALNLNGTTAELIDLPGTYSLAARSPDEMVVADVLLGQQEGELDIGAILVVVDASNLERNLYLVSQLQDFGKPLIIALNMMDIAERRCLVIHVDTLSEELGVPVVPVCAHKRIGTEMLKRTVALTLEGNTANGGQRTKFPDAFESAVDALTQDLADRQEQIGRVIPRLEAFRLLVDRGGYAERRLAHDAGEDIIEVLETHRRRAVYRGSLAGEEALHRYAWAHEIVSAAVEKPSVPPPSHSSKIDNIITHKVYGTALFALVMLVVFQAIFSWAGPLMDLIDGSFAWLGGTVTQWMPEGVLRSLVVDGVIAGVGGVVIFLPQILVLSFFIALLQDCGYMARAAFLMDRLFSWCGLSGQSFIPMLSSFACAIPGVMATRTIENRKDRLATMMVAPLMSCSARLPIYVIMIAAFIPGATLVGDFVNIQGLVLFAMYLLGVVIAIPMAWLLKKTLLKGETPPFVLELPSYKVPRLRSVVHKVFLQGKEFLYRAGTTIFTVAILVWALAYFPHSASVTQTFDAARAEATEGIADGPEREEALARLHLDERGAHLENSFLGAFGHRIEPLVRPLGWDWRIGTAVIASFPAREIIVATLGTIFNLGEDEDETSEGLRDALQNAKWPSGAPLFNIPVALSIMVFFALCCQCAATLVMLRRETNTWRWPAFAFAYMTGLAYVCAFIVYRTALWIA